MLRQLISSIPGVHWPAVPNSKGGETLSLLWQFEQSQWLSSEALRELQTRQLSQLLGHALRFVPWYRDWAAQRASDWSADDPWSIWRQMPVLTRSQVQQAGPQLHSSALPPGHEGVTQVVTGGSTGQPVLVLGTRVTDLFWRACTLRDHVWHGREFSQGLAVIRYAPEGAEPPAGIRLDNWGAATQQVIDTGPATLLTINTPVTEQLAWLGRTRAHCLLSYPSVVQALATESLRQNLRIPELREVRTFGEVLEPATREACRAAWDVPVVDMYSSQEVGYIALQCPTATHYHVQAEHLLVEVLNERDQPCAVGEVGRVVVTTLHNFAMPLVRYELGDYAEVGPPCECGRGLPVLSRILGRQRNMFRLPNGELRWPALELDPREIFTGDLPISQFQVVQSRLDELEVRLVAARPLSEFEEGALAATVGQWLGHPFPLRFVYVAQIARSPSGKFEDFRCELT